MISIIDFCKELHLKGDYGTTVGPLNAPTIYMIVHFLHIYKSVIEIYISPGVLSVPQ